MELDIEMDVDAAFAARTTLIEKYRELYTAIHKTKSRKLQAAFNHNVEALVAIEDAIDAWWSESNFHRYIHCCDASVVIQQMENFLFKCENGISET